MQKSIILYPVLGMAFLTLYVGIRMLVLRLKAVRDGQMNLSFFLLNKGVNEEPPEYLIKTEQHYVNLFELPVLFYVIVVLVLVLDRIDYWYMILAWLYFATRILHAIIHLTYNNLIHRRYAFLASTIVLYSIWSKLFVELLSS